MALTPLKLAFVTTVVALAIPAASQAATISYDSSGALNYQAAPGEKNYFNYGVYDDGTFYVSDSGAAPLTYPADECVEGFTSYVAICEKPTAVIASLGDGDDITNGDASAPFTVDAGPGKDVVRADINATYSAHLSGGAGDDKVTGGMGPDVIDGGDGDDELSGRDAADTITGGNGNDKLLGDGYNIDAAADTLDGGPGTDSIESEWTKDLDHKDPINVTLAGGADDGRAGEGDNLISIESVTTNLPGTYTGSEGADTVDVNQVEVPSTIKGLGGDDHLEASDANDEIDGGAGNDSLDGGYGDDHIIGGPGRDTIYGDTQGGECSYVAYCKLPYGNDLIDARDGEADSINCGVGNDTVNADAIDTVSTDCETVNRGGSTTTPPPGGDNGQANPPATQLSVSFTKTSLKKALKSGVKVKFAGPGAGTLTVKGLKGSKAVASGSGKIAASGKGTVTLKFTTAAVKSLKKAKSVKLTVQLSYTPSGGQMVAGSTKITLK